MMGRLIPVAAFTALLLGACSDTPTETANDVAEAREDAAEALVKAANANYDVVAAEAQGRSSIAKAKCDALTGESKDSCQAVVATTLNADMSFAVAARDAALLAAQRRE